MRLAGILALTHSSRRTNLDRCSAELLRRRFGDPCRLDGLPPFESLPPPEPLYSGAASFWRVFEDRSGRLCFRPLGGFRHRDKIQHVAFLDAADLLVGFEHRIERWRLPDAVDTLERIGPAGLTVARTYEHPHLAALHTVVLLDPRDARRALLSCAAPDAVLILDLESGEIGRTLRMPAELYGRNYDLGPALDLRRHFIGDEQQTTHLNAAYPAGGERIVVSAFIPGAVGFFDLASGAYEEVARGFVGCHGARRSEEGEIYFADSASGHLVFLDERGRVTRRFDAASRWLHDAQQLRRSVYAFALSDANELRVWDIDREELLYRRRFFTWPFEGLFGLARRLPFWFGNSTQALSFLPAGDQAGA